MTVGGEVAAERGYFLVCKRVLPFTSEFWRRCIASGMSLRASSIIVRGKVKGELRPRPWIL